MEMANAIACLVREAGTDPTPHPALHLLAAPGSVRPPLYRHSPNASFYLNLQQLSQQEAEMSCNDACGHLAAYRSAQEQAATEQFYITQVGGRKGEGTGGGGQGVQ
jgi:hypothetical protein